MSHEIRTPLNGILGASELIIAEQNNPKLLEQAHIINAAGNNLLFIFNDIMTFSEIERKYHDFADRPFHLIECVTESVEHFSGITHRKGLSLDFYVAPNIPDMLIGDSVRLKQVLSNLLSNAVKFTEKGGIKLTIIGHSQNNDSMALDFVVSDTGIGIDDGSYKKIFEDFTQRDELLPQKNSGIGVGLAVCKKICERMGGKIQVHSEVGKGSTFQFTITMKVARTGEIPNRTSAPLSPRHLLLAEDQIANQKLTEAMLKKMGHTVDIVANGFEAVKSARENKYDMILMDCQMPEMDGFEATKQIRVNQPDIPIVAITANALEGDRDKCLAAGMNDYIAKPVHMKLLKGVLEKFLSSTQETRKTG